VIYFPKTNQYREGWCFELAELRYNPFLKDWVMIASHRQNRPQMPKDWCPFCPGSGKVPDDYVVHKYDNDFPALSTTPPQPDEVSTQLFKTDPSYGKCEVILYSPEHHSSLSSLGNEHIRKLVDLWCQRYEELSLDDKIKYIFIFENRGEVVGVTMPHPHGQIYAYPFIPKKIELELASSKEHFKSTSRCLVCDMIQEEKKEASRVIIENSDFYTILPFFTEYPYGVTIHSKRHVPNIMYFSNEEKNNLAKILKETTGTLDSLFDSPFPYMLCMHQSPVNTENTHSFYHFHIEFYPPMRSYDKQKFNASSETGAWAHCNPTSPEEKAVELRQAYEKFLKGV
jgi:UDPglucose--hexose-1-phosphate uridylyltransferase